MDASNKNNAVHSQSEISDQQDSTYGHMTREELITELNQRRIQVSTTSSKIDTLEARIGGLERIGLILKCYLADSGQYWQFNDFRAELSETDIAEQWDNVYAAKYQVQVLTGPNAQNDTAKQTPVSKPEITKPTDPKNWFESEKPLAGYFNNRITANVFQLAQSQSVEDILEYFQIATAAIAYRVNDGLTAESAAHAMFQLNETQAFVLRVITLFTSAREMYAKGNF